MTQKAFLIPYNSKGEIFIQDRTDYKPPPWGFFGGTIEAGESHLDAVIRESKEELDLDLTKDNIIYLGELHTEYDGVFTERYFYVYKTNQETFTILEGVGGQWTSFADAAPLFKRENKLSEIQTLLESSL
jgi:8-oxo-dGTP pyrophosphatase MutT (NUDIX family)